MIVIYHQSNKVVNVTRADIAVPFETSCIAKTLLMLAKKFPKELLIWCHIDLKEFLNTTSFDEIFHHDKIMASFNVSSVDYFPETIGFIDNSIFLKIVRTELFPTWLISSDVGGINTSVILEFEEKIQFDENFVYFLHSVSKLGTIKGLFSYSEPKLVLDNPVSIVTKQANAFQLFKFVKQHYNIRWVLILFFNFLLFQHKILLFPFLNCLRFKNLENQKIDLSSISVHSKRKVMELKTIDVIIPTIGRKDYLHNVLKDLAQQTHLPENVIIVEQNPIENSKSELDYLNTEDWPFKIEHIFTHRTGVCNARNLALSKVTSEWVFLNDDDNRFSSTLIEDIFNKVEQYGIQVATTSYIQPHEKIIFNSIHQTGIFGSGNSFVKSSCLKNISFSKALEFGYGEDFDFGMQLRYNGNDVIYFPEPTILHLKAPFGGFRIKPYFPWEDETIQPKPSPTLMYVKQKYMTQKQIEGYKFVLFYKIIRGKSIFKWWSMYKSLQKQWNVSLKWAAKI